MSSGENVVLAGVDTLVVNIKRMDAMREPLREQELPKSLLDILALYQQSAQEENTAVMAPWQHDGKVLMMQPHGTPVYTYLLKNGALDLLLGARLHTGAWGQVRFSSEYLWRAGMAQALRAARALLVEVLEEEAFLQPSQLHLCADVAGLDIPRNYERVFVSRAMKERPVKLSMLDKPIYHYHRLGTLQFSGHGNPVSATIYDKPAEIEEQSRDKRWFYDLWRENGWDGTAAVWRVECRLRREALHEMEIEDTGRMLAAIPAIWSYCVGHAGRYDGWLRMVSPNARDKNRWRWKTAPAWLAIQDAFVRHWHDPDAIGEVQRERKRAVNLEQAEAAMAGYITTYAAWLGEEVTLEDDVSVVMARLYDKIQERWVERGLDFHELRLKKQCDYHLR